MTKNKEVSDYTEKDMVHKEGVDAVRQNIAMYAGDTSYNGFHHLGSEVIDNSLDECLAGYANKIDVIIHQDGSCTITDNGRGIPAEKHPDHPVSTLEVSTSYLHSSGKYTKNAYKKFSSGLHGIGLKLANFCSNWMEITVQREGKKYFLKYVEGVVTEPVKVIGDSKLHGTSIKFKPSTKLFRDVEKLDRQWFLKRLRDLSFLNPGITIVFKDERDKPHEETFFQQNGISDYVTSLCGTNSTLLKENFKLAIVEPDGILKEDNTQEDMKVDIAFNYVEMENDIILSFTNNIFNKDGGTHTQAFQTAITNCFNSYLKKTPDIISKKDQKELGDKSLRGEDYKQGLIAIISLKLSRPQFAGQTKDRLTNPETLGAVRSAISKHLNKWIEENPGLAKKIVEKAVLNFRAYTASKKAIESIKKDSKSLIGNNHKLKDCTDDDPDNIELFLVEGDSAAGTAINGRDPKTQAVLALGGKILNTWKATTSKMLEHEEVGSIIRSLGTGILDNFDVDKCKYGKIILMCDADVDGLHIRTLLLTFLFQRMRKLIENGKVFIAQSPLFKLQRTDKFIKCQICENKKALVENCGACSGNGKAQDYILTNEDFDDKLIEIGADGMDIQDASGKTIKYTKGLTGKGKISLNGKSTAIDFSKLPPILMQIGQKRVEVTRFKGLGELDASQLYWTSMHPEKRRLLQINIKDINNTTQLLETLMGNDSNKRKTFISEKLHKDQ